MTAKPPDRFGHLQHLGRTKSGNRQPCVESDLQPPKGFTMTELPPPPANWQPEPTKAKPAWKKERTKMQKVVGNSLAAVGALVILIAIVVVIVDKINPPPPAKHAKWQASIGWEVSEIIDPSTIKVWVTTKNVGQAAARPDCSISLHSSYSDDFGYETFTIKRIAPGHEQTWNAVVSISNQGASHITRAYSKVTCVDTQ
jgi:hypothetical protein